MIPKQLIVVNDFSSGEVDIDLKRGGLSAAASGGRQMANWRVLNSRKIANRPGRSVLFLESGRVDDISLNGEKFYLAFGDGYLRVYNAAGTRVFSTIVKGDGSTPIPWTAASASKIVWDQSGTTIYICYGDGFPANVPQVLTWDGVSQTSSWSLQNFATQVLYGWQQREPFYRISPQSIFIWITGNSAPFTMVASTPVFAPGMVGTYILWANQPYLITAYTDSQHVTVNAGAVDMISQISWSGTGSTSASPGGMPVGSVVVGSVSGAQGVIVAIDSSSIYVLQLNNNHFVSTDTVVGPTTSSGGATLTITTCAPNSVPATSGTSIWSDAVMNNYRGWPRSCFVDQNRLGFCDFVAVPDLICWSAIGQFTDHYAEPFNATADNAIQELAPSGAHVRYVVAGMESSEFVFCDEAVFYIPITQSTPLAPGSVSFQRLAQYGCYPVQPQAAEQTILFVRAGGVQIAAVQVPGAYYRPYIIDVVAELHAHLFEASTPIALAVPSASTTYQELYAYVLLANGTLVVGRYGLRGGLLDVGPEGRPKIGWLPWNGAGAVSWVSANQADVVFTTTYALAGAAPVSVAEALDPSRYLDAAISVNAVPAPLAAPAGKGPLWWIAGGTVYLIDLGTRFMGTYQVDADGWIVPQHIDGENLASAQLVAGQPWTAVYEPFIPNAGSGQDARQRTRRRKVVRLAAAVENSTGFVCGATRIPAYVAGDDQTQPAPLREDTYRFRFAGREFDPRVVLSKDTPGPLTVVEQAIEVTI